MKLDAYYVSLLSEITKNNLHHNLATPFHMRAPHGSQMRRPEKRQIIPALPILPAMRRVIVGFAAFFYILLLWGCANQTTPPVGQRRNPPRLLKSVPANKERNFKGKNIELVLMKPWLQQPKR